MLKFERLADAAVSAAIERGELKNLEGQGKPLDLTEDVFTPEDQRMTNRILKNAGYVPREVELLNELSALRERIQALSPESAAERECLLKELRTKEATIRTKIEALNKRSKGSP